MRIKYVSIAICFALLCILSPKVYCQQQSDQSALAVEFLTLMQNDSFGVAAELFHYPSNYSIEKKNEEINSVKEDLKKYKDAFGNIIETGNSLPEAHYIGIGVSGAEIDYWTEYPGTITQIVFPANFEKIGWAVVRILLIETSGELEIQQVDYSLVDTNENKELIGKLIEQD